MRLERSRFRLVVGSDLAVRSEEDRLLLDGKEGATEWAFDPLDADLGSVRDFSHAHLRLIRDGDRAVGKGDLIAGSRHGRDGGHVRGGDGRGREAVTGTGRA